MADNAEHEVDPSVEFLYRTMRKEKNDSDFLLLLTIMMRVIV